MPLYDAFISYSHAKDKPIAAALQSAVQKLGAPSPPSNVWTSLASRSARRLRSGTFLLRQNPLTVVLLDLAVVLLVERH